MKRNRAAWGPVVWWLLWGWLCFGETAVAGGAWEEELRVGTWNVRNYLLQDRWAQEGWRFEYPKPEEEKALVRRVLLRLQPEVLFLQELGSGNMLEELAEDLAASGLDYAERHFGGRPGGRSGLAVLSQVPLREVIFHDPVELDDAGAMRMRRGYQEVLVETEAGGIRFLHVHLKSRYTTDEADPESRRWREAELRKLAGRARARAAATEEPVVLVGDFNTQFGDDLFGGLGFGEPAWKPVEVVDARGERWTYHHVQTDRRDRIDGFWIPEGEAARWRGVGLFPLAAERAGGSDHRLVVVARRSGEVE